MGSYPSYPPDSPYAPPVMDEARLRELEQLLEQELQQTRAEMERDDAPGDVFVRSQPSDSHDDYAGSAVQSVQQAGIPTA